MNPATGQFLGPNTTLAIGALVPGTGNTTNGLFLSGQGIVDTTYNWPALGLAPRFGAAWDVTGKQRFVLRGGAGLFFDRPSGNSVFAQILNPPTLQNVTARYGQLQSLGTGGLTTSTPPALTVYEYNAKLPSSVQWNAGAQMALPWATTLDVSYVGQHGFNIVQGVNLNAVDYGAAFLPQNQDPTVAPSTTPGASALSQDLMRAVRGYSSITQNLGYQWTDVPLDPVVGAAPVQERRVVRLQRHDGPLRQGRASRRGISMPPTGRFRCEAIRPRPRRCSEATTRWRTS